MHLTEVHATLLILDKVGKRTATPAYGLSKSFHDTWETFTITKWGKLIRGAHDVGLMESLGITAAKQYHLTKRGHDYLRENRKMLDALLASESGVT